MLLENPPRSPRQPRGGLLFSIVATVSTSLPSFANAQGPPDPPGPNSLDAAVNAQLEFGNIACDRLVNGSITERNQLTGQLGVICRRGLPSGDPGASAASGNGAAAGAAAVPEAVRRRLAEDDALAEEEPVRGGFATLSWGPSDRRVSTFQDGYQGDVSGLLGGFDRELGRWIAGFTAEYWKQDGDFTKGGDFETTSTGVTGFGSSALNDQAEFAIYAGVNSVGNERVRAARFTHVLDDGTQVIPPQNGLPTADFDADERLAGAQFTYRVASRNLTVVPRAAIDWKQTSFDSYRETEITDSGLALAFYEDERTSLVATLGVNASIALSTNFGVIVIAEHLNYKHEFDDKQRSVSASFIDDPRNQRFQFQTEPPDTKYLDIGIDAIFLFTGGFQFFVGYEQTSSHRFLDTGVYSAGIRQEF